MAEAYLAIGEPQRAAHHARRALELCAAGAATAELVESQLCCAEALAAAGVPGGARRHLVEARRLVGHVPAGAERDLLERRLEAITL